LEEHITRFARPTWEELDLWDKIAGAHCRVMAAQYSGLGLAPGCRVIVNDPSRRSDTNTEAGWILRVDGATALVRISVAKHAVEQTNKSLCRFLTSVPRPGEDEDILVNVARLERHVLSMPAELRILDRVRVHGKWCGRVKAISEPDMDPIVTVATEDDEVDTPMSSVTRIFQVGDVVDVLGGPFTGEWGILVRVDDGPSADIFAVSCRLVSVQLF
jgi:hypothetical protein